MEIEVIRLDATEPALKLNFDAPPNFLIITAEIERLSKIKPTKLFYLDEEGDIISITTDVELFSSFLAKPIRLFFNSDGDLPNDTTQMHSAPRTPETQPEIATPPQTQPEAPIPQQTPTEETKDERFEREVDDSLNQIVNNFYDGDLQAKFISFFEAAKNWALALPSELRSWRGTLVWVLEQIATVVRSCGYTAEVLIRSVGWTLEEFSSFVLDRMRRDLSLMGKPAPAPIAAEVPKGEELEEDAALQDLGKLEAMGWTDKEENIKKLQKHKGDLVACVEEYLTTPEN
eukprot:TRINITY_DN345_c0_g1_i1.p1 TRINITY_DN345_c0_g1~~TRINITY_DN345_c0_g1_i1.p1  ORF type:complete len:288 (+),score=73.74 TRINITY_DN345_c0_g1_i1:63-926(+)